jgi:phospholipid-binding lipoprotein MlaA
MSVGRRRILALVVAAGIAWGSAIVPARAADSTSNHDPLERFNRVMFRFNDTVDIYFLEPVAEGWDKIAPDAVQHSVSNFFDNLNSAVQVGNCILQGKFSEAGLNLSRFMVRSTIGIGGLLDPGGSDPDKPPVEDFGQTLGVWRVPAGPYIVLPFLGPSNPRDFVGSVVDFPMAIWPYEVNDGVYAALRAADIINFRASVLEEVRDTKASSLDYYVAVRNAYIQHRESQVRDSTEKSKEHEEDLYYIDE